MLLGTGLCILLGALFGALLGAVIGRTHTPRIDVGGCRPILAGVPVKKNKRAELSGRDHLPHLLDEWVGAIVEGNDLGDASLVCGWAEKRALCAEGADGSAW
jgi:hypothetical protein